MLQLCVASAGHSPNTAPTAPPPPQRSDEIAAEKNRALKAALNADLRKTKATLLEQAIPLLEKMAKKGKGLSPEKIQARLGLVSARWGGAPPLLEPRLQMDQQQPSRRLAGLR